MIKEGVIKSLEYRQPRVNLECLTEKRNRVGTIYYEATGEIVAKVCRKCDEVKSLDDYLKLKAGLGGRESTCKTCVSKIKRTYYESNMDVIAEYREANKERQAERSRQWYQVNKGRRLETVRAWRRQNRDKMREYEQRRISRKKALTHDLTKEQYSKTLEFFDNACAWTGRTDNLEKEHAIPQSIGGGFTFGNIYPMVGGLNQSKQDKNIFEWFEANRQRFELSQDRFDTLIAWLASANAMTVEEYRDHVYWCHANPRNINELEAN